MTPDQLTSWALAIWLVILMALALVLGIFMLVVTICDWRRW